MIGSTLDNIVKFARRYPVLATYTLPHPENFRFGIPWARSTPAFGSEAIDSLSDLLKLKEMADAALDTRLKEMILAKELAPGERVTEAGLAERLGVSRTPVRSVLPQLAAQGFLRPVGKRGYVVANYSDREILEALDLRAVLEGWAARWLAEHGAPAATLEALDECLAKGDLLFAKHRLTSEDEQRYGEVNARFHGLIIEACRSAMLDTFVARLNLVPFVAPAVIVFDQIGLDRAFELLHRAHGFHHAIVDAIRHRDGARAEFLFREHANHQRMSMFERRTAAHVDGAPARPGRTGSRRSASV